MAWAVWSQLAREVHTHAQSPARGARAGSRGVAATVANEPRCARRGSRAMARRFSYPAPDPPLTAEVLAQLRADVSEWVEADSTRDEDDAMMRRLREAGGVERIGDLPIRVMIGIWPKAMQNFALAAAGLRDTLDRRARAQERLERLIRVILLFSKIRVALLEWYDETCKKRYAPGGPGEADAAEEFAGAARGQKRPRDEAGPSQ